MMRAKLQFPLDRFNPSDKIGKIHFMQTLREASQYADYYYMGNMYLE